MVGGDIFGKHESQMPNNVTMCCVPIPAVDERSHRAPMPEKRLTKPHSFVLNVEALVTHALQMRLDQGGAVLLAILDNAERMKIKRSCEIHINNVNNMCELCLPTIGHARASFPGMHSTPCTSWASRRSPSSWWVLLGWRLYWRPARRAPGQRCFPCWCRCALWGLV